MAKDTLTKQLALRVTAEEAERVERFAARIQIASVSAVTRAAVRVGLDALEKNPALLFEPQDAPPETCTVKLPSGKPCRRAGDSPDGKGGMLCGRHLLAQRKASKAKK